MTDISNKPTLYVAIGPSGSGKSTVYNKLKAKNPNLGLYSWDALRHEFYDEADYARAWELSARDPNFKHKVEHRFQQLLDSKSDIYVDNTNLTPKRRKPLINKAKELGYRVIAITFDVNLKTLIARQTTRGDKNVPADAVTQQFNSLRMPTSVEGFDKVISSENI
ncbi:MAG: AAA family ATPase [Nitrososphaeraceae archaeon]